MPLLANASTFSPETEIAQGTAEVLTQNLVTDHVVFFDVPENEGWQVIYAGMRFVLSGAATTSILGARAFIINPSNPLNGLGEPFEAAAQAAVSQIQGEAAPRGTFIVTPSTPYGEVGPGRRFGMAVTVLSTAVGDDVEESQLVAEIRRFRLVSDPSVLQVQPERTALDGLNLRLLNRR